MREHSSGHTTEPGNSVRMDLELPRAALTPREMWECVRLVINWLELTPPFTIGQFHQALEQAVECPVVLRALLEGEPGRYGACEWRDDHYVVTYQRTRSLVHQTRTIYHEFGHIVLNHVGPGRSSPRQDRGALASIMEHDAELFSELITRVALFATPIPPWQQHEAGPLSPYAHYLSQFWQRSEHK